jgi:hypothetical protein
MISRIGLLVLGLLSLPMSVSAAIVNIEFSAHVNSTTGDGMGYAIDDLVTGTYVIDTSKAEGKNFDLANEVWYYGSVNSGLLQSTLPTITDNDYYDFVTVSNYYPGYGDHLSLSKVLNAEGSVMESLYIGVYVSDLDWISDLSLNNINLISNEAGESKGGFSRIDLNTWSVTDSANFWLDSVKITSTSVPEPAPLALLVVALAGLVAHRRSV